MKRIREITIIHFRRRRVKKSQVEILAQCPVCGNGSEMITVAAAAKLTGLSLSTLNDWITRAQVHATQQIDGQPRICHRSLSERMALGELSKISTKEDMLL